MSNRRGHHQREILRQLKRAGELTLPAGSTPAGSNQRRAIRALAAVGLVVLEPDGRFRLAPKEGLSCSRRNP